MKAEDYVGAMDYFKKVTTLYTNSTPYLDAIGHMATCYEKLHDHTNEVKVLEDYVQKLDKSGMGGVAVVRARYELASGIRQLGGVSNTVAALNRFSDLGNS